MHLDEERKSIVISKQISSMRIMTIDVSMTHTQLLKYNTIHFKLVSQLTCKEFKNLNETDLSRDKKNEINDQFNMQIYCRLRHAFFSSSLKSLYLMISVKKKKNLTADMQK